MKYDSKTIGERIREGRKAYKTADGKRLTQEGLAEMLHYKRETINRWEKGKELPPLDVLFKLCDVFPCDLGFLLGEHKELTRSATDIVENTNLTGEAVRMLQEYRISTNKRAHDQADKFFYPDEFIPALISYMLTSGNFNQLINRICSQNRKAVEYAVMPDIEKEIVAEAYETAHSNIKAESITDAALLRSRYQDAITSIIAEKKDAISDHIKSSVTAIVKRSMSADADRYLAEQPDEFYEFVFTERMKEAFDLVSMEESEIIEMNNFLNQKDMFSIVTEFMEPITKYRK